jgi:hypothetical protein
VPDERLSGTADLCKISIVAVSLRSGCVHCATRTYVGESHRMARLSTEGTPVCIARLSLSIDYVPVPPILSPIIFTGTCKRSIFCPCVAATEMVPADPFSGRDIPMFLGNRGLWVALQRVVLWTQPFCSSARSPQHTWCRQNTRILSMEWLWFGIA